MGDIRVLLVDDEPELVFTMAERLELRDIDVDAVTTGEEALKYLEVNEYDVLVVDVKMPGMSGHEVLATARDKYPNVGVILLTGHGGTEEGAGLSQGAFAYLFKPVEINELIETMLECAGKHS